MIDLWWLPWVFPAIMLFFILLFAIQYPIAVRRWNKMTPEERKALAKSEGWESDGKEW